MHSEPCSKATHRIWWLYTAQRAHSDKSNKDIKIKMFEYNDRTRGGGSQSLTIYILECISERGITITYNNGNNRQVHIH